MDVLVKPPLLFQIKCQVGSSTFQLPLSCPLTAALGPGMPPGLASTPSSMIPPGYLVASGSYGGVVPPPLYSQQWSGAPGPVGLLGAAGTMTRPPVARSGVTSRPLVMDDTEKSSCSRRTT